MNDTKSYRGALSLLLLLLLSMFSWLNSLVSSEAPAEDTTASSASAQPDGTQPSPPSSDPQRTSPEEVSFLIRRHFADCVTAIWSN
jgi:hypothetical protein